MAARGREGVGACLTNCYGFPGRTPACLPNVSAMETEPEPTTHRAITRIGRAVRRPAGLVILTGLAAGGGFAAVTGISDAASSSTSTAPSSTAPSSTAPSSTAKPPAAPGPGAGHGWGHRGGPGGGFGRGFGGGFGFGGAAGTITAINGSTLTLRTENGTETVKTTSTTKYTKERQTFSLAKLRVGDIVRIDAPRPTTNVTPGTGTVTATQVDVVLPELGGRVTAVAAGQYSLVGPAGQLLTISVDSGTRYYSGQTAGTAAAVKVGSRVVAEGTQDSLTHLKADTVTVLPTNGPPGKGGPGAGGWHR